MDAKFWLDKWESNQIGFHEAAPHPRMEEFWPALAPESRAPVFVPLCGKSVDMCWLRHRGHPVVGVEISAIALRDFFDENDIRYEVLKRQGLDCYSAASVDLYHADIFDYARVSDRRFDLIYDRAALIALTPEQRCRYVEILTSLASPQAKMLLITVNYDTGIISPPPHIVTEAEITELFAESWKIDPLGSSGADIKGQPGFEFSYCLTRRDHA